MDGRSLLISDVDGTLLGDESALSAFARWRNTFRNEIRLAYASGRFFESVMESIHTTALPEPDAIIGGVGTEVREYPSGETIGDWPGPVNGWNRLGICAALADVDGLQMQAPEFLSDHKISYHMHDASEEQLAQIATRLERAGCHVDLIYSSARDLDVLPRGVNKGSAAGFLANVWGVAPHNVVVCGDSGNDLPMFVHGFHGVVVGNAQEELRSLNSDRTYFAQRCHAAGVLEGLAHWSWLTRQP